MDMICLSFECKERGVFCAGNVPWSDQEIAAAIGGDTAENLSAIAELLAKGVCSRNDVGAIFCRRVVRDEHLRRVRASSGSLGGRPKTKTKAKRKQTTKQNITPSSSSSSSTSSSPSGEHLKTGGFAPPSVAEVEAYCRERGNSINPEKFVAYYAKQGWKLSNGLKMTDWKQAVITWEGKERDRKPSGVSGVDLFGGLQESRARRLEHDGR